MLEQEIFRVTDPGWIRDLARAHPWATLISHTPDRGLVVSHLPVLVDDSRQDTVLLGHLARTDARKHELGSHDVVVVLQGPHGYLSPVWYGETPHVPTWNFTVLHVHGRPEVLDPADTYDVLSATVDHFEDRFPEPWRLARVESHAHRIAAAVTGFRLPATKVTAKAKLSQDEREEVVVRLAKALESGRPYASPELARAMRDIRRKP
ncbi:FMN-binding negative transcriptional regulator [Streptomyces sp. NBC_00878]|uniref:FMN-binding negative transcriptional regulator n=1 Tax=Streptomyces sp. NBC_00878 TaxID=2975854 RepID=UPI0022544CA0|nr:FMN-binding negative transcriptional regulator [Streptomyces sp. NBC_00878]MCX4904708.1 FMN-binding negative transcriptional regulator [Streptomyces sp. NBC_00878]